jgi:transglutaminase-like putative cysteine protease
MRLKVRHETSYTYARAAASAMQIMRLTPRSTAGQFVRRWRVEIDADCRLYRGEDAFGNITHTFSVEGPLEAMTISVDGEVDVDDSNGLVSGATERFPLGLYLKETALTRITPAIRAYARLIASGEGGDRLATLHALLAAIHRDIAFTVGATDPATSAAEAFQRKAGVCQDLSHVFIAAARSLGVPARYVGGYFLRTDTHDQEAGHAWAEAHVAGLGWIAFDPANGICAGDRHLRVACGLDYLDAAPTRGARIGGEGETLAVRVHVSAGRGLVELY